MVLLGDIILDNPGGVYTPGQILSGRVVLTLNDRASIKALALKISGYAGTRWEKARKQKKPKEPKKSKNGEQVAAKPKPVKPPTVFTNREDYLSTLNYFMGSEDATPKMVEAGSYHYSFSVRLPGTCPSSYESAVGHVRYHLDFFIEYPEHRHTCAARSIFVYAQRDLREDGIARRPLDLSVPEKKSFVKYWQTPLQLEVHIPHAGYVTGEAIAVNVKVQNNDLLTLTDIVYTLYRVSSYAGVSAPKQKPTVEVQRTNLLHTVHTLFGQNGSVVQHSQLLQVPQTPPTTDAVLCKCLQIGYEVEVRVNSVRRNRSVCATLPIIIGTISLHSDVKLVPGDRQECAQFVPAPAQTMLVARSMGDLTSIQEEEALAYGAAMAPSAPPAVQAEMPNIGASMGSLASVFREAEFMSTTILNKKSMHTMSGDKLEFKPKYLYYEMNNGLQEQEISSTAATTSNGQNLYPSLP